MIFFMCIGIPSLNASLFLEEIKSIENLVPDFLDSSSPLSIVAHSIIDLSHFSHSEGFLDMISPEKIFAVLLAFIEELDVSVEGI